MFKKIDKLLTKAFIGPFFLTFGIVIFILLTVFLSKYFEDMVGKDLGFDTYVQIIWYFALNQTPLALPLAVLLSSLMAFGNLGEHYEITAIKGAGISLTRTLVPISVYALLITGIAFIFNNKVVPFANLKAYSLMYDVRQKKPAMEFKEGGFYNGLPGYSIRIEGKKEYGKDQPTDLYGLMIYDHTAQRGNTTLIMADTAKMYTIHNKRYLVMELGKGYTFNEFKSYNTPKKEFKRDEFQNAKFVFSLESFGLQDTPEELFKTNRVMKDMSRLAVDADSLLIEADSLKWRVANIIKPYYDYLFARKTPPDSLVQKDSIPKDYRLFRKNISEADKLKILEKASTKVKNISNFTRSQKERLKGIEREHRRHWIEWNRKITLSVACFVMFLIGAPLGAIIKKGGLGVPVLVSISFFLLFYFTTITGEKYAREEVTSIIIGCWFSNFLLLLFGLFFLRQARNDSRILETDAYYVFFNRIKRKYGHYFPKFPKKQKPN